MRKNDYYLYLDESGNFSNASDADFRCSLVGGLFTDAAPLTEAAAKELLTSAHAAAGLAMPSSGTIHGVEIPGDRFSTLILSLLEQLEMQGIQPLVFENEERVEIVDADTTYIHLVAEGITRFFSAITTFQAISRLHVTAARRMGFDKENPAYLRKIPASEYRLRIEERMSIAMLRQGVKDYTQQWILTDFRLGSAREDYRLMLADCICHAWYSRQTKFNEVERDCLERALEQYHFTVVEDSLIVAINRNKNEGAFGDALFHALSGLLQNPASAAQQRMHRRLAQEVGQLVRLLAGMSNQGLRQHLSVLLGRLEYLAVAERDYAVAERLYGEMVARVLSPLEEMLQGRDGGIVDSANLLAASQLVSLANHQGKVSTVHGLLRTADQFAARLHSRLENIDDILGYLNRKAVHLNNAYAFTDSISLVDTVIQFYEEIIGLSPIVLPSSFPTNLQSMNLGKLYGSKLQSLTMAARKSPECYHEARRISQRALQEFSSQEDLKRQHLYRSHLELAAGDFSAAWNHLLNGAGDAPNNPRGLAQDLKGDSDGRRAFVLAGYCRLMAALILAQEKSLNDFGRKLWKAWDEFDLDRHAYLVGEPQTHPAEIIHWKLGMCDLLNNQIRRGLKRHEQAIGLCFAPGSGLTLNTIGLAVLVEQAACLLRTGRNADGALGRAVRYLNRFLETKGLPPSMGEYFSHWPKTLAVISGGAPRDEKVNLLFALAWEVPY